MKTQTHTERLLELLSDGQPHLHHELYALGIIAHSRVSDLRRRGYRVDQWRDGDDYVYRLVGSLNEATVEPADAPAPVVSLNETDGQFSIDVPAATRTTYERDAA